MFNYETYIIRFFGDSYSINESLVYSLQFSQMRTKEQVSASKSALSKDLRDIVKYIDGYRTSLEEDIFNSQEYSIKLIQIPKVSNTSRSDLAIEFVKWNQDDEESYKKLSVLIKDKKVKIEGANIGRLKPGDVVNKVKIKIPNFTMHIHTSLFKIFNVRPISNADDPFETDIDFCHYDEAHKDYLYRDKWIDFIVHIFENNLLTIDQVKTYLKENKKLNVVDFRT